MNAPVTATADNAPSISSDPVASRSRIAAAFSRCKAENRAALMPFWTAGYPTLAESEQLLRAIIEGGSDLIELGVPFSDPMADGTTVQHTSQVALEGGTSLADCLRIVKNARAAGIETPIVLMGYSNPFYRYGLERLAKDAVDAGVDGFIVPDLPLEESDEFLAPLRANGLDLIFFIAPTSTETRIKDVAKRATGFIYCVSLTGVTGARDTVSEDLPTYIARVKSHTTLPLAIGFGISRPDHVREIGEYADGVIVASALINYVDSLPAAEQAAGATRFVREMATATLREHRGEGIQRNGDQ